MFEYSRFLPSFILKGKERFVVSPLAMRLASGVGWSFASTLLSRGSTLLASIFVARILGVEIYGEFGVIQGTVAMFQVFASFGMGIVVTKYVAEMRNKDTHRAGRVLALTTVGALIIGIVVAGVLFATAPWVATKFLNAPHLADVLRITSLLLLLAAWNGVQNGAMVGFEAFKSVAKVNLFAGLLGFPLIVGGVYWGGLKGGGWGLVAGMAINCFFAQVALRKETHSLNINFEWRECFRELNLIWRFAAPATLAGAMVAPVTWVCIALLVNQADGYSEIAVFNAGNQWFAAILFLPNILIQPFFPVIANAMAVADAKQVSQLFWMSIKLCMFAIVPLILALGVFSPFVMGLYGEGFANGWLTLIVILATSGLVAIQRPIESLVLANGNAWIHFCSNLIWAVGFLVFTLFLVKFGALGLATARGLAYVLRGIFGAFVVGSYFKRFPIASESIVK